MVGLYSNMRSPKTNTTKVLHCKSFFFLVRFENNLIDFSKAIVDVDWFKTFQTKSFNWSLDWQSLKTSLVLTFPQICLRKRLTIAISPKCFGYLNCHFHVKFSHLWAVAYINIQCTAGWLVCYFVKPNIFVQFQNATIHFIIGILSLLCA